MEYVTFQLRIDDWYDLHSGYTLNLYPGYTALVGPNGAGKTTLLSQIEEIAKQGHYDVFRYSNLRDGGKMGAEKQLLRHNLAFVATSLCSSEGENVAMNFGNAAREIGAAVAKACRNNTPLFILLDGLDSGASIDRARDLMHLFGLIESEAKIGDGKDARDIYILVAVNSYELARKRCLDVRTGEYLSFKSYEEYAEFICNYLPKES